MNTRIRLGTSLLVQLLVWTNVLAAQSTTSTANPSSIFTEVTPTSSTQSASAVGGSGSSPEWALGYYFTPNYPGTSTQYLFSDYTLSAVCNATACTYRGKRLVGGVWQPEIYSFESQWSTVATDSVFVWTYPDGNVHDVRVRTPGGSYYQAPASSSSATNQVPTASNANISASCSPQGYCNFALSGAYDPEGQSMIYVWDTDGDGYSNSFGVNQSSISNAYVGSVDSTNVVAMVIDPLGAWRSWGTTAYLPPNPSFHSFCDYDGHTHLDCTFYYDGTGTPTSYDWYFLRADGTWVHSVENYWTQFAYSYAGVTEDDFPMTAVLVTTWGPFLKFSWGFAQPD
jgi:hypothetical protein